MAAPLEYPRDMLAAVVGRTPVADAEHQALELLVDSVFFASTMVEESEPVRLAVVFHPDGAAGLRAVADDSPEYDRVEVMAWEVTEIHSRSLDPLSLAKLSRGVEYGRRLIVVGGTGTALRIDGIARRRPHTRGGRVLRIAAPRAGTLVFELGLNEVLRYEGGGRVRSSVNVLGEDGLVRSALHAITNDGGMGSDFYSFTESALRRLLPRIRNTGAGAILAISPTTPPDAVLDQLEYRFVDPTVFSARIEDDKTQRTEFLFTQIDTVNQDLSGDRAAERERLRERADAAAESLDAAIDDVARLSAIDGAVLAGPNLAIYGAGYKIPKLEPIAPKRALDAAGHATEAYDKQHGARHRAAFSFAYTNPGAVAFVFSEDGPVSCALRVGAELVVWPVEVIET